MGAVPSPYAGRVKIHMKLYLLMYTVVINSGWLLWSDPLVLGCRDTVYVSWGVEQESKEVCLKSSQDLQSKNG